MKRLFLLPWLFALMIGLPSATAGSQRFLMPASVVAATQDPPHDSVSAGASLDQEARIPLIDRTPWLVHLILLSPGIALAWILFLLARAKVKEGGKLTQEVDGNV
jgi:hypothetical protein